MSLVLITVINLVEVTTCIIVKFVKTIVKTKYISNTINAIKRVNWVMITKIVMLVGKIVAKMVKFLVKLVAEVIAKLVVVVVVGSLVKLVKLVTRLELVAIVVKVIEVPVKMIVK